MRKAEEDFRRLCRIFLTDEFIRKLSIALTQYAFRSGPIEDIHSDSYGGSRITQAEMMELNKYMVDKLAGLFVNLQQGNLQDVEQVLSWYAMIGHHWDDPIPNEKDFIAVRNDTNDNSNRF